MLIDRKILKQKDEEAHFEKVEHLIHDHPVVKKHHGKWKELLAWVDGQQFSEWMENSLAPVPLKRRQKRVIINIMKPLGETLEGKIDFSHSVIGTPNSPEQKDVRASQIATKVLSNIDHINDTEQLYDDAKYDLINTGNCFVTWQWDKSNSGFMPRYTDKGTVERNVKKPGEVTGRCPSVFNIRPDPVGTSRGQWRYLLEIMEVPTEEVCEAFGIKQEKIKEVRVLKEGSGSAADNNKYSGMNEKTEEKDKREDTEIVAWYWEKSSPSFPKGRLIISIPDVLLYAQASPSLGKIPYWHIGYKRSGNSLWHKGPMHFVQDIQREINRSTSMISEHNEGWRAKMVVPPGSIMKKGAFTADSFELLEIDPSKGPVTPLRMPELSPQVTAYRDFLLHAKDLVSNVHEVSRSQLPKYASRAPASLFAQMLEQENLKITSMMKRINKAIRSMAMFKIELARKYYKSDRLVKSVGKGKTVSLEYFKGADLQGNYDIRLEKGASLFQSQIIQQRMILELRQMGILTEEDRSKIIKALNLGDITDELSGDIVDENRAESENRAFIHDIYDKEFKEGGVKIYFHDNHPLHMDIHTNLRKSDEAQKWDKNKLEALDAHIGKHFELIQILQQMAGQQAQQGQGPGPMSTRGGTPPPQPGPIEGGGVGSTPGPKPPEPGEPPM